jgi:26S proteasome regulatory subunit N9
MKIMSLIELIFTLPKNDRNLSFEQIGQITSLHTNYVEFLIIQAMSLDLIKGKINQVIFK